MMADNYITIDIDTTLDASTERIALFNHNPMEPYFYKLRKQKNKQYQILPNPTEGAKPWIIWFKNGELHLLYNGTDTRYVSIGKSNSLVNNNYALQNTKLLNNALKARGHVSLNNLLNTDSLGCDCNKWINKGTNLVSKTGEPEAWILEEENDSLFIYQLVNHNSPDDPIIKKKLLGFKWTNN